LPVLRWASDPTLWAARALPRFTGWRPVTRGGFVFPPFLARPPRCDTFGITSCGCNAAQTCTCYSVASAQSGAVLFFLLTHHVIARLATVGKSCPRNPFSLPLVGRLRFRYVFSLEAGADLRGAISGSQSFVAGAGCSFHANMVPLNWFPTVLCDRRVLECLACQRLFYAT